MFPSEWGQAQRLHLEQGRKKADWADQDFNSRLRLRIETVSFVFPSHHQLVHRDVPATASELTVKKRPDRMSLLYQQYLNCIWVNMPHTYMNSCVACLKSHLVFLQCFDSELWTNKMSDSLSCCGGGWGLCVRIKWLWKKKKKKRHTLVSDSNKFKSAKRIEVPDDTLVLSQTPP